MRSSRDSRGQSLLPTMASSGATTRSLLRRILLSSCQRMKLLLQPTRAQMLDEAPALGVDMYRTRTVGGIRFHRDVFEHATDPTRSHARLIVHCELHPLCSKRRGIGWRQQTPLGHWQPFAWLGAWHARAAEFASQSEHVQFAPTLAEQRDWKERNAEP